MSVTPEPTVLVATESENVIRIYAGHPRNGGVHQTGQFTTNRPIDPTDLANMAMDLSNTFGWFEPAPTAHIVDVSDHARAIKAPPVALAVAADGVQMIPCPMKGCAMVVRSDNLPRHLMSQRHKLSKQTATVRARMAREAARNGTAPTPEPKPEPQGTGKVQVWKQMVACPECGKVVTRNNLTVHLQSKQHGYTKERATEVARALPNVGKNPRGAQPHRVPRHGVAGARELENVWFPRVLQTLTDAEAPMTAQRIALELHQPHQTVKGWMTKLHKAGRVDRVEPTAVNGPMEYTLPPAAPAVEPPAPIAEPNPEPFGTMHAVDSWTAPMYDVSSHHTDENERNPTQ